MIKYKTTQQEVEFNDFGVTEPRLYGLVHALALFVSDEFGKDIVVTGVARHEGSPSSPHYIREDQPQTRAVDIRCHHNYFTEEEHWAIREWLKIHFPRSDMEALELTIADWYGTMRHHGTGDGEHLHVCIEPLAQFRKKLLS